MSEPEDQGSEQQQASESASEPQAQEGAADTFKQGLGLLWKAAKSAAQEIKQEVDKGSVSDALQQAGQDLDTAAQQVGKTLDDLVDRLNPRSTTADDDGGSTADAATKQVDADVPADGGTTDDGERRDMRIQVEDGD